MSGDLFQKFIAFVRSIYDYIILDTPPLNLVIDGLLIAKQCDGAVLVVESGLTERAQVKKPDDRWCMRTSRSLELFLIRPEQGTDDTVTDMDMAMAMDMVITDTDTRKRKQRKKHRKSVTKNGADTVIEKNVECEKKRFWVLPLSMCSGSGSHWSFCVQEREGSAAEKENLPGILIIWEAVSVISSIKERVISIIIGSPPSFMQVWILWVKWKNQSSMAIKPEQIPLPLL